MFEFVGLAGLGAIFYAARSWLQTVWAYVSSIMIVRISLTDGFLRRAVEDYVFDHMKPSPLGPRTYDAQLVSTPLYGDVSPLVVSESLGGDTRLFWKGYVPLWVSGSCSSGKSLYSTESGNRPDRLNLTFFRYSMDIKVLLNAAVDLRYGLVQRVKTRHQIVRKMGNGKYAGGMRGGDCAISPSARSSPNDGWNLYDLTSRSINPNYLKPTLPVASLADMWLCQGAQDVLADVEYWFKSRAWFIRQGIRWRRNYCLWGDPGTGKSTFVRFLAQKYDLPLFVIEINTMCDRELFEVHESLRIEAPCVVLYEDVDNSFHKREKAHSELECSFAAWQNVLDGVKSADGIITFVTTNKPDCLDDSVARYHEDADRVECTRPGRIDIAVRMEPLTAAGRWQLSRRYLPMLSDHDRDALVNESSSCSAAVFQDACIQRAVRMKFEKGSDGSDDCCETVGDSVDVSRRQD